MNLGRGRQIIPKQKLHRSVGLRLNHDAKKASEDSGFRKDAYTPHAKTPEGWPKWSAITQGTEWDNDFWED